MKLAFVFPGQGSQSLGMLSEMAAVNPIVEHTFTEASDVLGYDLWDIVQNGPVERLNETQVTQPAMLAAGVAIWRAWQKFGGTQPEVMAGHSLGEYTALVCAGALQFKDAVSLVADRGHYMQHAVPAGEGAMAAILGLDDTAVIAACAIAAEGEIVAAVNFNSPGQVVIAGQTEAVKRAVESAKEAGAKRAIVLPVSVPSHCQLMEPAAHDLAERLQKIPMSVPSVKIINNVDVANESDPEAIRDALIRQLCNPVRWVESIEKMINDGAQAIVECGPGKVLVGLNKRINKNIPAYAVYSPDTLDAVIQELAAHRK